jgi:hypothetical protein
MVLQPYYAGEARAAPAQPGADELVVALKGGHRVGQTFTAAQNHLAGIWIPTKLASGDNPATSFHFHLTPDASIPWPHLSPPLKVVRAVLIVVLLAIFLWLAAPYFKQNRAFWFYFAILVGVFVAIQKLIRSGGGTGLDMPVMFQAVVVFHYWSWYVFSFDKLRALTRGRPELQTTNASHLSVRGKEEGLYDKLMANLRSLPRFTALVIILNLLSAAGVVWFAKLHGPGFLRYIFDYSYFLYFLVFHVTFSFAPRQAPRPKPVGFRLQEPAKQVKA